MAEIDIISVFGRYAKDYGRLLRSTAEALKSKKHKLNWLAVTTGKCPEPPKGWQKVHHLNPSIPDPAIIHAEGLMEGLKLSTAPYVIFADVDVALLARKWDQLLVESLSDKIPIVGFEYGGGPEKHHYQKFPTCTFCLCNASVLKSLNINMRKGEKDDKSGIPTKVISDTTEAKAFGKEAGEKLILETGWRMPKVFKDAGYKGKIISKVLPYNGHAYMKRYLPVDRMRYIGRKLSKHGTGGDEIMHEYMWGEILFATHMRRSRKYRYGSKIQSYWLYKIMNHFRAFHKISIPELNEAMILRQN